MAECWVYKMYCTESQVGPSSGRLSALLYVGISDSPSTRMGNHESQKWWWWLVDNIDWERFYSRDDAKQHETQCITRFNPPFNYQESQLSAWERMRQQVDVLWKHESNTWDCPPCPICESHGVRNFMCPSNEYEVFLRNCDDKLVIHWTVSCPHHRGDVQWAQHCFVSDFLIGFGKCPKDDAWKLVEDATRLGPTVWENRLKRESTLFERVDATEWRRIISCSEMLEAK